MLVGRAESGSDFRSGWVEMDQDLGVCLIFAIRNVLTCNNVLL